MKSALHGNLRVPYREVPYLTLLNSTCFARSPRLPSVDAYGYESSRSTGRARAPFPTPRGDERPQASVPRPGEPGTANPDPQARPSTQGRTRVTSATGRSSAGRGAGGSSQAQADDR